MKLTYKAIARAAGYRAYRTTAEGNPWAWEEAAGYEDSGTRRFSSEIDAYKNCCAMTGLVEPEQTPPV